MGAITTKKERKEKEKGKNSSIEDTNRKRGSNLYKAVKYYGTNSRKNSGKSN
jgi:hypothetical protein